MFYCNLRIKHSKNINGALKRVLFFSSKLSYCIFVLVLMWIHIRVSKITVFLFSKHRYCLCVYRNCACNMHLIQTVCLNQYHLKYCMIKDVRWCENKEINCVFSLDTYFCSAITINCVTVLIILRMRFHQSNSEFLPWVETWATYVDFLFPLKQQ